MRAIDTLNKSALVAHAIWEAQQVAAREYRRQRLLAAQGDQVARELASLSYGLMHALVQAAAVRLSTAWEIFLRDLLGEFLAKRPGAFKSAWQLRGGAIRITDETLDEVVETASRPFQDLEKAKNLLKKYLGNDIFGTIDLTPVKELIDVRNAIVHLGGAPTKAFRNRLKTRKTAQAYLLSRPGAAGSLPTTHFERILAEVLAVANVLYARSWQRPRS